jgi:hypothetical protein
LSSSSGLGFGGFLVGLGLGWYIFRIVKISYNVFAWLLIIAGAGMILSSLLSWGRSSSKFKGITNGIIGGLILSLFLTSGFGIIEDITRGGISLTYREEDTKSYSGVVTVGKVYLEVDNFNGPISVSTWDKAEYSVDLTIKARITQDLEDFKVDFDESVVQDRKRLILKYDVLQSAKSKYAIEVEVFLPADALIDLDLDSSNGGIYLTEIEGDDLRLSTSNGPLVFDNVYGESVKGGTSNGRIEGDIESRDAAFSTSNGKIDLTLPCTVSGEYDLSTSNSGIELKVSSLTQVGYDLDLSTSNGNIDVDFPGLYYSLNQRTNKEAQTEGFSTKALQITIKASTSNAGIDIGT